MHHDSNVSLMRYQMVKGTQFLAIKHWQLVNHIRHLKSSQLTALSSTSKKSVLLPGIGPRLLLPYLKIKNISSLRILRQMEYKTNNLVENGQLNATRLSDEVKVKFCKG